MEVAEDTRGTGVYVHGYSVSDKHDDAASVGKAADRRGFPGVDVHCIGVDCAVPHQGRGHLPSSVLSR